MIFLSTLREIDTGTLVEYMFASSILAVDLTAQKDTFKLALASLLSDIGMDAKQNDMSCRASLLMSTGIAVVGRSWPSLMASTFDVQGTRMHSSGLNSDTAVNFFDGFNCIAKSMLPTCLDNASRARHTLLFTTLIWNASCLSEA